VEWDFFVLLLVPEGLLAFFSWMNIKWIITISMIVKGIRKWRAKNRESVGLSTENPPQSHVTIVEPKYGTADVRFVITEAPQNDICPQGNTYPKKAVLIVMKIRIIPLFHAIVFMWDL